MSETQLPEGFADLEPLVEYWAGENTEVRWNQRASASMDEIRSFYDIMLKRADAALEHLQTFPLDEMPEPEAKLFRLVLSLAQAAMAVELHGQPRAPFSPFPHKIRITLGARPFA